MPLAGFLLLLIAAAVNAAPYIPEHDVLNTTTASLLDNEAGAVSALLMMNDAEALTDVVDCGRKRRWEEVLLPMTDIETLIGGF